MKSVNYSIISLIFLFPYSGYAQSAGQTANGCTYQVVNGKYSYSCPNGQNSARNATNVNIQQVGVAAENSPTLQATGAYPQQQKAPAVIGSSASASATVVSTSLPEGDENVPVLDRGARSERKLEKHESFSHSVYVGLGIGAASIRSDDANIGSLTSYTLQVGGDLDEHIAGEFSYSYQGSDVALNLQQRSGGTIAIPNSNASTSGYRDDASLSTHIINLEGQFHPLDSSSRVRPYIGIGLGYKTASLKEKFPAGTVGTTSSSISQGSLGLTPTLGIKFRISEHFQAAAAGRYFLPIFTSNANFRQRTLFQESDTSLTSSAMSQILVAIQYVF